MFERAARHPASEQAGLTDLSAAYLTRFEAAGDCLDLLRAIYIAERASALQPANSAARFNRATALSLLGARHLATEAWREIVRDDEVGWKEEAAARLRVLQQKPIDERWAAALARVDLQKASKSEIEKLTADFPAHTRTFGEEVLLPRWAKAIQAGDRQRAERSLLLAAWIGETLARTRQEHLLSDAASAASRVIETGSAAQRQALLLGLQSFGAGVALYNEQNVASAKRPLTEAARDLAAAGNPLWLWSHIYVAIIEYYSNAARGLAMVEDVLRHADEDRYPAIVGRAEWVAGTADKVQGRVQSSVRRYERAAVDLRRAGGESAAAFVSVLLAESYTLLGEHSMAWATRKRAFQQVALSEGPRRNVAMWSEAKEALLRQGSLSLAGPLVEEAVAVAEQERRPISRATAHLDHAAYELESGDRSSALSSLSKAQRAISEMEPSGLRDQMTFLAHINEGLCSLADQPARAAVLLRRGLEGQHATGTRFDEITYTTALADAEIAAGNLAGGVAALEHALGLFEEIRATVEDPVSRMHAFRQAQPAFDRLIGLKTTVLPDDDEQLFVLAERSRARVLLEMTGTSDGTFVRPKDVEKILPPGVGLVSYVVLDDSIIVWVVEDGRTRRLRLPLKRTDIEKAIEKFRLELKLDESVAAINEASRPLYDMLIRPLALSSAGHSLIIVPDRWLVRLPFAALFDGETGRYLIEQRTVTTTPSATLLLRKGQGRSGSLPVRLRTLAVAVANSGSHRGMSLQALPGAGREAKSIASVYDQPIILTGTSATRENFLRLSLSIDVLHFAGHAVVDLEAPRRSVLLFSNSAGDALEPLSLGELLDGGGGKARLVVLSACRTQDSAADEREGFLGLAGAFIAGGAQEVLASSLDVDDRSSPIVMTAFHRRYREHRSAGIAYRAAVLDLLRSGPAGARSPAVWGGFTVIERSITGGMQ